MRTNIDKKWIGVNTTHIPYHDMIFRSSKGAYFKIHELNNKNMLYISNNSSYRTGWSYISTNKTDCSNLIKGRKFHLLTNAEHINVEVSSPWRFIHFLSRQSTQCKKEKPSNMNFYVCVYIYIHNFLYKIVYSTV